MKPFDALVVEEQILDFQSSTVQRIMPKVVEEQVSDFHQISGAIGYQLRLQFGQVSYIVYNISYYDECTMMLLIMLLIMHPILQTLFSQINKIVKTSRA